MAIDPGEMSFRELRQGWPVVAAGFTGMLISGGAVATYVLGPITKPLQAEFHWSRPGISLCQSLLALGITLGTPIFGWLADRSSPRLIALASTVAFCACFAFQALSAGQIREFQLMYFLCGFLGAGSAAVIYTKVIGGAFQAMRGIALGIVLSGTGATALIAPVLVTKINEAFGWRAVFGCIAGLVLVVLPIVYRGLGRRGSRPNGLRHRQGGSVATSGGFSRRQALHDIRFYVLLICSLIFGLFIGSLIINLTPVLIDRGFTPVGAAQIASVLGIAIIAGRLLIGTLLDRFAPSLVGAAVFGIAAVGVALFLAGGASCAIASVAAFGVTTGAELDIFSFMALRYFGLREYGTIFAMLYCGYTATSIVGPVIGAMILAAHGYRVLFATAAAGFMLIAFLFLILGFLRAPPSADRTTGGHVPHPLDS
jgi:MFS family permease